MSEIEQLTKQKEDIEANQAVLRNWISLKKNLSSKFKNPAEAFKGLVKEGKDILTIEDFGEFAKGLDLTEVLKDTTLNEENFVKAWEQWEFKSKQNDHKLQIVNEKLQLLTMLDQNDGGKQGLKGLESFPNKKVQGIAQNCETLEELQQKLETMAGEQQKQKTDVVENEQDCFAQFLAKKSEVKFGELQVSKLQLREETESKQKRSYIDGNALHYRNKTGGTLLQSSLQNKGSLGNSQISVKQSFIIEPSIQISPTKGQQILRSQPQLKSPYEERQVLEERKSHKVNRMKGDLQNYISHLFQDERDQRNNRPISSEQQKGLSGFMNYKKSYKPTQVRAQQQQIVTLPESTSDVQKRVQSIRYKLDDFQTQKLAQFTFKPEPFREVRLSNPKPKQTRQLSPKYTPGNTHRLNLDYLKSEKERDQAPDEPQVEA